MPDAIPEGLIQTSHIRIRWRAAMSCAVWAVHLCRLSADTDRGVDDMYGAAGGLPP